MSIILNEILITGAGTEDNSSSTDRENAAHVRLRDCSTAMASITLDSNASRLPITLNDLDPGENCSRNEPEEDAQQHQLNDDITEEELRITLISSVEEKLKVKLEEEVSKTQAEIQCLHHTNRELLDRQEDICKMQKNLEEKLHDLSQYTADVESCGEELEQALNSLEQNVKVLI